MALNLYLDDCSNSVLLADLLRQAGHRVVRPTDDGVGLDGEDDEVHFGFAAANGLALITKNPADLKPFTTWTGGTPAFSGCTKTTTLRGT